MCCQTERCTAELRKRLRSKQRANNASESNFRGRLTLRRSVFSPTLSCCCLDCTSPPRRRQRRTSTLSSSCPSHHTSRLQAPFTGSSSSHSRQPQLQNPAPAQHGSLHLPAQYPGRLPSAPHIIIQIPLAMNHDPHFSFDLYHDHFLLSGTRSDPATASSFYHPQQFDSPMNRERPHPFTSLLAADALLNLSASPQSPFVPGVLTQSSPWLASPHTAVDKEQNIITPLQGLFSSPGQYWNLTNSISPILRSSSPDLHRRDTPSDASRGRRGQFSSAPTDGSEARRLNAIHGLSPLSDLSTASSDTASQPDTTPSAPSSSASQAARILPSPVITADDWERPRRYSTRARTRASGDRAVAADPAQASSSSPGDTQDAQHSNISPDTSSRKRLKRSRTGAPATSRPFTYRGVYRSNALRGLFQTAPLRPDLPCEIQYVNGHSEWRENHATHPFFESRV